jgi:glycerol-3-phosphate acyltransferase PlsX
MARIAVDAMGGDHAPSAELDAAITALRERRDLQVILVGDEARLRPALAGRGADSRLSIRHASQVITMDDAPAQAVRAKKDSSMRVAFELVKAGEADAVVSAGNSGAMMACGLLVLKRVRGVERPGIVTTFPTLKGPCVLCDMGANVDIKPTTLAQFGVLGAVYARVLHGKARPRVGLLSNGEEDSKGTELTRAAHALLRDMSGEDLEYTGYVEGKDIFSGAIDVVATDGFTGNVVLKTSEGAAATVLAFLKEAFKSSRLAMLGALLAKPALEKLRKKIDYAETGGAPLLGVDGVVLICHGRSNSTALKNAILAADRDVAAGLRDRLAQAIKKLGTSTESEEEQERSA